MAKKSTSPWIYVGCGCASLVVLAAAAIGTLGFLGFQFVRDVEEGFRDPVKRQEQAMKTLGATALPEGFHTQMYLKVPLILEMAILSDGEPVEYDEDSRQAQIRPENLGENAFVFMSIREIGDAREDFERLLEGDTQGLDNVDVNLDFHSQAVLGRGEIELPPQALRYVVHRGEYREGGETREGTYAAMLIDCPGSSRIRAGFYWQQQEVEDLEGDEDPEGGEDRDLEGTAYEEGLRAFMGHFNVCGS